MATSPTRRIQPRREGSAIALVAVFLAFVAVIAIATSYHGQQVRSQIGRSHHGYELVELCDSAISEAAAQLVMETVFPKATFGDMKALLLGIAQEDEAALTAAIPGGYKFRFGDVLDATNKQPKGKIFIALEWPATFKFELDVPKSRDLAAKIPGFKGPLEKVTGRVLTYRRDFVGNLWQNWGVVQYKIKASMEDGNRVISRTMYVDRMFALRVDYDPRALAGMPAVVKDLYINWASSERNLRTVIERS